MAMAMEATMILRFSLPTLRCAGAMPSRAESLWAPRSNRGSRRTSYSDGDGDGQGGGEDGDDERGRYPDLSTVRDLRYLSRFPL